MTYLASQVLNGAALAMIAAALEWPASGTGPAMFCTQKSGPEVPVVQSMVADLTNNTNCGSAFGKAWGLLWAKQLMGYVGFLDLVGDASCLEKALWA